MLTLARAHVDAIVAHARADYPDEACGVIVGPEGADLADRYVKMTNAERSPTFFQFDPAEQLALYKAMDANDEEIVVIYHSHTFTEAYPSRTDIGLATEPQAHYVLVSLADDAPGADVPVRSYRILDGEVVEEEIRITQQPAAE